MLTVLTRGSGIGTGAESWRLTNPRRSDAKKIYTRTPLSLLFPSPQKQGLWVECVPGSADI